MAADKPGRETWREKGRAKGLPAEKEITFTLDRPFLFCVQSQDGLPLFIGVVEKP